MTRTAPVMATIGMLGGMGWPSTIEYYRLANELTQARFGGHHSARVLLASVDFAQIEHWQAAGQWDAAARLLAREALALERAGADLVILCSNTMHMVADEISAVLRIPFLHIGDTTAEAVERAGLTRVGLLGTAFTMEKDFYRSRLADRGIETIVPEAQDRAAVHRIIYDELIHGTVDPASRVAYQEVIGRLVEAGAEGIILGCTEIELLVSTQDCPVPSFPTTRLHVEGALRAATAPLPGHRATRLDHVVIAVTDWDASVAFYRDVVGAVPVDHPDGRLAFRLGDTQLNVHGPGLDYGELVAAAPVAPGGHDLCLRWPGTVAEIVDRLHAAQVPIIAGPVPRAGAGGTGSSVYVRDPDGALIEFLTYPSD